MEKNDDTLSGDFEAEENADSEAMVCPNCLAANDPEEPFCRGCGAPVGLVSTLDPVQKILAEGYAYRQAVDGPPKRIILIGIWILFLPQILVAGFYFSTLRSMPWEGMGGKFFELLTAFYGLCCLVILYRATANHLRHRPPHDPEEESSNEPTPS